MKLSKVSRLLECLREYRKAMEPNDVQIIDKENKAISHALALVIDTLENDIAYRINNDSY